MRVVPKIVGLVAVAALTVAACGSEAGGSDGSGGPPDQVTIAVGSGIAYAPLTIMKNQRMLEQRFPDTEFVWQEGVSGGAATRDGMIGDQIQVGVAGIAPFLIGLDRGVDWRVLGSMGQLSIDLVTLDPNIRSIRDLDRSNVPISLPSPDSGQAIVLKALGERELGDPAAFDDQLAPMGHPDAFQALLTGTTGAAFIGPPFQYRLVEEEGAHRIASASDVFGQQTYSAVVLMQEFYDEHPQFAEELFAALEESLTMLRERPAEAAAILSEADGGEISAEQYEGWLTNPETEWQSTPRGFTENAEFMQSVDLISEVPESTEDYAFPTVSSGS